MAIKSLDQLLEAMKDKKFLWVVGTEEQGISWCSDCDRTKYKVLEAIENIQHVKMEIDKVDLRNPHNEFRKHPKIALKCVPTLLNWETGERLEEGECGDKGKLNTFFGK
jgi:hypothetical protein